MKRAMLEALEKKYEAEIAAADATINIYLNNSVGIGEHPQHLDEIDKLIEKIANAKEKMEVLHEFEPEKNIL
jgi:CO dehydrogenase nickel-insertion accessory protein CooC1|tara:strand:+ start:112 stop:327 length:216 start_codon:yes stop_codon:yes gene_type:complete